MKAARPPLTTVQKALVGVGVLSAVFVCTGSAVAVYGFSGYRGEVCTHLGDLKAITERTGRLTHCDQRPGEQGALDAVVFDVSGDKGKGRVFVKSRTDAHGNEQFSGVLFVSDGEELLVEGARPLPR